MLFLIIYNTDINELITHIVLETDKVYNYTTSRNIAKDDAVKLNILMKYTNRAK